METELATERTGDWRPVVWLIGIILLVHGIGGALTYNPYGIWQMARFYQSQHIPAGYSLAQMTGMAVQFLLALGLIAAGVGLWRREGWARRAAIVLLGCQIAVAILIAFTLPMFQWHTWQAMQPLGRMVSQPPYWVEVLQSLQPFTLISNFVMLLVLSVPAVQQELAEASPPGILTDVAEWGRSRLPAGTPPLWLFIGLLFLCWGAGPWLNQLLSGRPLLSISPLQDTWLIREYARLLPALAYLIASVLLLLNWRWSRQAAITVIILDIVYQGYWLVFSVVLTLQHGTGISPIWIVLLSPINIILQLAIPVVILLFLRKAQPEGVGEPVPEG